MSAKPSCRGRASPRPNQLRLAVLWRFAAESALIAFRRASQSGTLTNYSWLSRLSSVQYATPFFDLVNPGLCALKLPIALGGSFNRKRYEKGTALVAAYSPRLKRIGIQNWRRASTVAGMSRQAFDAQRGVAKGIAGRPASSTQWNRIGRSR